jgi:hypothetical protein
MPLKWHGAAILAKVRAAEVGGLQETLEGAVSEAKGRVRVDSGELQSAIDVLEPAHMTGGGATGQFGVEGVAHALAQEFGLPDLPHYGFTPYLRPSFDIHAKQLAGNITKRM